MIRLPSLTIVVLLPLPVAEATFDHDTPSVLVETPLPDGNSFRPVMRSVAESQKSFLTRLSGVVLVVQVTPSGLVMIDGDAAWHATNRFGAGMAPASPAYASGIATV